MTATFPQTQPTPGTELPTLCTQMLKETHILIAGTTGSGKSTLIHSFIYTAMHESPADLRFVFIDPKKVELAKYRRSPHTLDYADTTERAITLLGKGVALMENRYKRMQAAGQTFSDEPAIWFVIDELADLLTADKATKTAVELRLIRLAQLGRAANIHLLLATQTPHRSVITAQIKLNIPCSVALRCREAIESRLILGRKGAEELPMYGRGYYSSPAFREIVEVDIPRIPEEDVTALVDRWAALLPVRTTVPSPAQSFVSWLGGLINRTPRH